eukprot:8394728-Pyramimonas_sp.AAC.1
MSSGNVGPTGPPPRGSFNGRVHAWKLMHGYRHKPRDLPWYSAGSRAQAFASATGCPSLVTIDFQRARRRAWAQAKGLNSRT